MGLYIFLTLAIAETIFAAYCLITKCYQQKVKSLLRIAAFAFFALLVMSPIIDWSSRYYSIAALLLLLAITGVAALIRNKEGKRPYKASWLVFKGIGMILLIFVFTLPSIIFPQHGAVKATGEFDVQTASYSYTDTNRTETYTGGSENRKLNVEMWFPKTAEGKYPLIVFSHGAFGIKTSNLSLYNELASHGYVVCSIDHSYQCLYTKEESGHTTWMDKRYMKEISAENAYIDKRQSYELYQKWMSIRTGDINFVIDYILAEAKKHDADTAYKLVDNTKIGAMGHSLGGSAALGIGRMRDDVSAVIALESPFMCDIQGVKDGEFVFTDAAYPMPVLNVYSDQGWSLLSTAPQYAKNYALLSSDDADAFNLHISGVGHLSLTDLALESPILTRILNGKKSTTDSLTCLKIINKVCLDFFDHYLKGEHNFVLNQI